ncbi:hypothetical protein HJG60_010878 [Phyllostomus discolor]|uniref:Uncharacterized protein n=1 Tax=Phyllostomus discolor TaxID=89673 RepID=A0A834AH73_9CHIR|nr:hypothetical protein HJG60_010878 [Phyllostomus discolor]
MRKPSRTSKCGPLLPILYISRITPPTNCLSIRTKHYRLTELSPNTTMTRPPSYFLKHPPTMTSMHTSLHSKNTIIWPPPLTTKSSRRGSHRRFNSSCSNSSKTGRLRHTTHHDFTHPTHRIYSLPIHNTFPMRNNYNQLHLLTSNRP